MHTRSEPAQAAAVQTSGPLCLHRLSRTMTTGLTAVATCTAAAANFVPIPPLAWYASLEALQREKKKIAVFQSCCVSAGFSLPPWTECTSVMHAYLACLLHVARTCPDKGHQLLLHPCLINSWPGPLRSLLSSHFRIQDSHARLRHSNLTVTQGAVDEASRQPSS